MPNFRLICAAVKPAKRHEHTDKQTNRQTDKQTDCIFIYMLKFCSLRSQNYSKATAPGFSNSKATAPGISNSMIKDKKIEGVNMVSWCRVNGTVVRSKWYCSAEQKWQRYLPEKLVWPEMTFNDLEDQNHIAYSAIRLNMSMYAKYEVNPCSG